MKVRVTIMTENDKHIPDGEYTKEQIESHAYLGWKWLAAVLKDETGDKISIEKCELVER